MDERMKEKEKEGERWTAAIANLTEISSNLDLLQRLLIKKAVYVDGETFGKASLSSEQARAIKVAFPPLICFLYVLTVNLAFAFDF